MQEIESVIYLKGDLDTELIMSTETMKNATQRIDIDKYKICEIKGNSHCYGRGDIHDIGKGLLLLRLGSRNQCY